MVSLSNHLGPFDKLRVSGFFGSLLGVIHPLTRLGFWGRRSAPAAGTMGSLADITSGAGPMLTEAQRRSLNDKGVDWGRLDYVEAADVLDALDRGNALVVDTRKPEKYELGHFPGAVHRQSDDPLLLALPREWAIYTYCT